MSHGAGLPVTCVRLRCRPIWAKRVEWRDERAMSFRALFCGVLWPDDGVSREFSSGWGRARGTLLCQTGGARISGLCCPPVVPSGLGGVVPVSADPPAAGAVARSSATR